MNRWMFLLSVVFGLLLMAAHAEARITVFPSNGGTYMLENPTGNVYRLTLTATAATSKTTFTIVPSTALDTLEYIKINSSNSGGETALVLGSPANKLFKVQQIDLLDEQGVTYIQSADISGDLENVELNRIDATTIDGDVNGYVVLRNHTSGPAILSARAFGN